MEGGGGNLKPKVMPSQEGCKIMNCIGVAIDPGGELQGSFKWPGLVMWFCFVLMLMASTPFCSSLKSKGASSRCSGCKGRPVRKCWHSPGMYIYSRLCIALPSARPCNHH